MNFALVSHVRRTGIVSKLCSIVVGVVMLSWVMGCREQSNDMDAVIDPEPYVNSSAIANYLQREVAFTSYDGEPFCAYDILDIQPQEQIRALSLWVLCQEYYQNEEGLQRGGAISVPISLNLTSETPEFEVISHRMPRDGSYYPEDLEEMFSAKILAQLKQESTDERNQRVKMLVSQVLKAAQQ